MKMCLQSKEKLNDDHLLGIKDRERLFEAVIDKNLKRFVLYVKIVSLN